MILSLTHEATYTCCSGVTGVFCEGYYLHIFSICHLAVFFYKLLKILQYTQYMSRLRNILFCLKSETLTNLLTVLAKAWHYVCVTIRGDLFISNTMHFMVYKRTEQVNDCTKYSLYRARICKRKEPRSIHSEESILGLLKRFTNTGSDLHTQS